MLGGDGMKKLAVTRKRKDVWTDWIDFMLEILEVMIEILIER